MLKKSNRIRTLASITISILFIGYLYINRHSILNALAGIKLQLFLIVILGQILAQISNSFILKSSLKPLGVKIKSFEAFRVTVVSSFVNFFTPVVGGASAKAVYLKSRHKLSYTAFVGALYANYVVTFTISFAFGLLGLFLIPGAIQSSVGQVLILFFLGGLLGSSVFILFGHKITGVIKKIPVKNRILKTLINKLSLVDNGWLSIRSDTSAMLALFIWSVALILSLQIIYWSSVASLGLHTSLGTYMIYAALASVSLLFNLTPGSIGVREALYASTYKISGIIAENVVAFSLVDRAAQLMVLGASWIIFGNSVLKDLEKREK